jgi:peptide/nickel transport system substrate-binding protein
MAINKFGNRTQCCIGAILGALCILATQSTNAMAEPKHGISMHGDLALPADYTHFPYANPNAPQGGKFAFGVKGTFDSINPFLLKSMRSHARGLWSDSELGSMVYEPLMIRSRDEPFSLYGLVAEKVEMNEERTWIEFTLNPNAKFSDGHPITADDVIFTFDLLTKKGRPPYSSRMKRFEKIEKTGDLKVKITFNEKSNREYPLIVALSPVLPKHAINIETFDKNSLEPIIGSGPYRIKEVKPGTSITYEKREDYWAKDLPSRVGFYNFKEIKVEYFLNESSRFEAFKKGIFDINPEGNPENWRINYDFNAVESGDIIKDHYEVKTPATALGMSFNIRREKFSDIRVRQALTYAFDFEWMNKNLYSNAYTRTTGFYDGSNLSAVGQPANEKEQELLASFEDQINPDIMAGTYQLPKTNGSGQDRKVLKKVFSLFKEAGYKSKSGKLIAPNGEPLTIEMMCQTLNQERIALGYQRTLKKLGIELILRTIDDAQYQKRSQTYDYDMKFSAYSASLSPGAEQVWRWGSRSKDVEGTFNFSGVANPAVDAMIDAMLNERTRENFVYAVRAYDRALMSGQYMIPLYHLKNRWVARRNYIERPEQTPLYGFQYQTWWDKRAEK